MLNFPGHTHGIVPPSNHQYCDEKEPAGCDRLVNIPLDYFRLLQQFDPNLNSKPKRRQQHKK